MTCHLRYLKLLVILFAVLLAAPTWAKSCADTTLDILLTNDDGFDRPGIQALHTALKSAGHRVTLAAPARNSSGSSTSLTLRSVTVNNTAPNIYAVDGSPATAVLLALSALYPQQQPDLVVSGINAGANLGPATPVSGTVGATVAALLIAPSPVPGIAVSTDAVSNAETSPKNLKHLSNVAQFTTQLIARLQRHSCDNSALLPAGIALNVNYPPLPREKIKGVRLEHQGKAPLFKVVYEATKTIPGEYSPRLLPAASRRGDKTISNGDTQAFDNGYVTVVPIDADYTAAQSVGQGLGKIIGDLAP